MAITDIGRATGHLVAPEIEEMLDAGRNHDARDALVYLFDAEIADVLIELAAEHRAVAFRLLPRARATDVFTHLPAEQQEELLKSLSSDLLADLFNEMDPDDRAETFDELPGTLVNKLFALLDPEERRQTQIILGYPAESIGRIMTPDYVRVRPDWTAGQVLEHIRRHGGQAETLDTLYVIDRGSRLVAEIRLHDLLLAELDEPIEKYMQEHIPALRARDDQEVAVGAFERHDRPVLPVVDSDGVLVGVVTFDDVADVAEEEVTEDIQKMAAVEALEEPYLDVSLIKLVWKRGFWLGILFIGQMLTISAMENFESILTKAAVLVMFVPLVISSGGNTGSQAASLVIRAMAIGEVRLRDWWRILRRELVCGMLLGVFLGMIGLLRIVIWQSIGWGEYTTHWLPVSFTVGLALVGIVLWGTLVGSMLPLLFRRLGLDPATSSAPFVTTVVDITGILIYLYTAMVLLRGTLL
ncbi:MAG: magnesium transporter [Planctomycetes bacterium]|nr:magnesium transporter [Planctomycetota bacterium]